jgi:gliding motility-associated-like protein
MHTKQVLTALIALFIIAVPAAAQDFSNKGKDFWVGYGWHARMNTGSSGGTQDMVLYFATEAVTNVTVEIPVLGYSKTYSNIPANAIFTTSPLPKSGGYDARLTDEGISKKGIHITSDQPIVAYAHIYNNNVSGATLLFPVNTLGKEYYSVNFKQVANEYDSRCWFYAIAVDTGTTTVEITPSANTKKHPAGVPFTVQLRQGEIINLMGKLDKEPEDPETDYSSGVDLTGSLIRSVVSGNGQCKRIAVFSGSGKISLTCTSGSGSADNYIVQAFPKNAWGKKYLTVPTASLPYNYFRICVSDPSTVVKMNGTPLTGLVNGFYYEVATSAAASFEADKPIMVAQYITTQSACGNGKPGDPEVIYLSPVEQNIDKVILNSTSNYAIEHHWINVVIKASAAASFRIDGSPSPVPFVLHPQDPSYVYAQIGGQGKLSSGQHILQAEAGFNAIAYGYGNAESYGYNAGTNVKDLYQFVSVKNQYATVDFPATCKASPFNFNIVFPYQPTQISWKFKGLFPDTTLVAPEPDSTWNLNGKQLYRYKIDQTYMINSVGTYPVKVLARRVSADNCGNEQEIDYDLKVYERPSALFSFTTNGCITDSVRFKDESGVNNGRPITRYSWDFGDGTSSEKKLPAHLYAKGGDYGVRFSVITDIGCVSDTAQKVVALSEKPLVRVNLSEPVCIGKPITLTDASTSATSPIVKWNWDLGDGTSLVKPDNAPLVHSYTRTGNFPVKLVLQTATGCVSDTMLKEVVVSPFPKVGFSMPGNCLADPFSQFMDTSRIEGGTEGQFTYFWNFGDRAATAGNPNSSTLKNPTHKYTAVGPYLVSFKVVSGSGCADSLQQTFIMNGTQPLSVFSLTGSGEYCSNDSVTLTNNSSVDVGNIVKLEIYWDAANPALVTVDNTPRKGKTYSFKYPEIFSPASSSYTIRVKAYSGELCSNESTVLIQSKATPEIVFNGLEAVCANEPSFSIQTVSLNNSLAGNGIFSGKGVSAEGLFDPASAGVGTHSIRYTFTGTNGCRNHKEQAITVNPVPGANAGPDRYALEGGSIQLLGKGTGSNLSYVWTPDYRMNNDSIPNPDVSPDDDITYKLTVISTEGCINWDEVIVKVLKKPTIPNAFSPNGDGVHDKWEIAFLNSYPGATVEIYNRYGQVVYKSSGYDKPWDGRFNGNPVPVGTYYYLINPKNGRKQISGFVDVIR